MTFRFHFLFLTAALVAVTAFAGPAMAADYFDPVGTHDRADCQKLAGWAKDGDTTLPTQVAIYKGAPYPFGVHVLNLWANLYRPGLPFADKHHGFNLNTPAAFFTGCPEKVYIYGIDLDTNGNWVVGGNNQLLNLTGKTVNCGQPDPSCYDIDPPDIDP